MSRIGKKPIDITPKVEASVSGSKVTVKGPEGSLTLDHHPRVTVKVDADAKQIVVTRDKDDRESRALHGLTRSLIANMVQGVVEPYEQKLEIVGVGYQATMQGNKIALQVGFANTIVLDVPPNVVCELPSNTQIRIRSTDKQAAGQFAAVVRRVRPPEPYKGKGIRYVGEPVRRKAGKAFGS